MKVFLRITYIITIILFIYGIQYAIQANGDLHYSKNNKIFDIIHLNTFDLNKYTWIINIIPLGLLGYVLFGSKQSNLISEFFYKFLLILILRAIIAISTILPKHEKCEVKYDIQFILEGGCYDKLFSGHTAIVTLLTLMFVREKYISLSSFWILNIINMSLIILTHAHYTADVLLGFIITYLVYDGNYNIFTNFFKNVGK
jgi:membrane-associated phospholipid phosphatase